AVPGPAARSGQQAIDLRKEPGEVESARAGRLRRREIGAVPVALLGTEPGILAARLGPGPVVFVVGEESGQVAEPGPGPGREGATAVALGAHHGLAREEVLAQRVQLG